MTSVVQEHIGELIELCREYHVAKLSLFGSAATDAFKPETSDLDFLVTFHPMPSIAHKNAYFGLIDALEHLFKRPVDLIEEHAIKNPYFREEVEETKVVLYAA